MYESWLSCFFSYLGLTAPFMTPAEHRAVSVARTPPASACGLSATSGLQCSSGVPGEPLGALQHGEEKVIHQQCFIMNHFRKAQPTVKAEFVSF